MERNIEIISGYVSNDILNHTDSVILRSGFLIRKKRIVATPEIHAIYEKINQDIIEAFNVDNKEIRKQMIDKIIISNPSVIMDYDWLFGYASKEISEILKSNQDDVKTK